LLIEQPPDVSSLPPLEEFAAEQALAAAEAHPSKLEQEEHVNRCPNTS